MPSPVDKYYKEVSESNPDYSEAQAWATAWSIYCKHKNPGSDHCKKDTDEYLQGQGKSAGVIVRVAARHWGQVDPEGRLRRSTDIMAARNSFAATFVKMYTERGMWQPAKGAAAWLKRLGTGIESSFKYGFQDRIAARIEEVETKHKSGPFRAVGGEQLDDAQENEDNGSRTLVTLRFPTSILAIFKIQVNYDKVAASVLERYASSDTEDQWKALFADPVFKAAVEKLFNERVVATTGPDYNPHAASMLTSPLKAAALEFALDKLDRESETTNAEGGEEYVVDIYGKTKMDLNGPRRILKPVGNFFFELVTAFRVECEILWPGDREYDNYL